MPNCLIVAYWKFTFFSDCLPLNSFRLAFTFSLFAARLVLLVPSEILFLELSLPDPLCKWYKVMLSNSFDRFVNSMKDVERFFLDVGLTEALMVPFSMFGSAPKT